MPTATSSCENYNDFLALHKAQLEMSFVPQRYWHTLFTKLKNEVFDAGDTFTMHKVQDIFDEEDYESEFEDMNGEQEQQQLFTWHVTVAKENGIDVEDPQHIYLIHHAWTYSVDEARVHLETVPSLWERMAALMDIPTANHSQQEVVNKILEDMWRFNQTYTLSTKCENSVPLWYIMDELGSHVQHSDTPTIQTVPFCFLPTRNTFTLMWPLKTLKEGEELTRNYVRDGGASNALTRKVKLLPWQPDDMRHLSYEQHEEEDSFMMKYKLNETLPNLEVNFPGLPCNRNITIFTDVDLIASQLNDNRFELVADREEADIIWTDKHLKDFRHFSEESSEKFINQFPFEMVITTKDLLAMVCRRAGSGRPDPESLDTTPRWMQATYNLKYELPQFVSYFQHRNIRGMENYWICKPFYGSRRLDTHITNSLGYILRLPDSGPKVACKYVEDPVLIEVEGIGLAKFDTRFVVMLHSVEPLQISVHKKFVIRMAEKEFSMDHSDDADKHLTSENVDMTCDDFVDMFEAQYPAYPWNNIEAEIYDVILELFNVAINHDPPKGIGHSPQSRAMYGFDFLLKWTTDSQGERQVQPVLVNVTSVMDLKKHCQHYPGFINQCFSALFLDDFESNTVIIL